MVHTCISPIASPCCHPRPQYFCLPPLWHKTVDSLCSYFSSTFRIFLHLYHINLVHAKLHCRRLFSNWYNNLSRSTAPTSAWQHRVTSLKISSSTSLISGRFSSDESVFGVNKYKPFLLREHQGLIGVEHGNPSGLSFVHVEQVRFIIYRASKS